MPIHFYGSLLEALLVCRDWRRFVV
ncbi:MAG: hypothetical protein LBE37_12505 [Sphingobacterium sp.]|nr:hypothetical protein [Sphingobacterium sp.]